MCFFFLGFFLSTSSLSFSPLFSPLFDSTVMLFVIGFGLACNAGKTRKAASIKINDLFIVYFLDGKKKNKYCFIRSHHFLYRIIPVATQIILSKTSFFC